MRAQEQRPQQQPAAAPQPPAVSAPPAPTVDPASAPPASAAPGDLLSGVPAAGPSTEPPATTAPATLPHDLSPWGMFMQADIVVKAVMVGLAFASLVTWTVWFAKALELAGAKRKARSGTRKLQRADSLAEATTAIEAGWTRSGPVADLVQAAARELKRSPDLSAEGVKERLAIALSRIEAAAGRSMTRGTGLLATIGATAPFVGLFGTVWGIMNSFIGIAQSKTTNLAVVAPGIAEALLATAIGLVAAIPAVIIYNVFARAIAGYRALLSDASGEVLQHLSRDLERNAIVDAACHPSTTPSHLSVEERAAPVDQLPRAATARRSWE
ncbi:tonB-system energizer ExbB [Bradyrhizobium sp. RDI18]|uniref:tonB-system energizer ExbB n=1 Tax=Bradyrhizobium sp. RDI18 TaxID=3367400 RepID=UPI003723C223